MKHEWRTIGISWLIFIVAMVATGCRTGGEPITPRPGPTDTASEPSPTPPTSPVEAQTAATMAIAPRSGPPGTEVEVAAAGFSAGAEIELGIGPQGAERQIVTTVSTDADGRLATTLAIPSSAEPGETWMVEATTTDETVRAVSSPFEVIAAQYDPMVSIAPTSGTPGTEVQVTADGFPPDASVEVGLGPANAEYEVVDTVQTTSDGSLTAEVTIPAAARPGARWVAVVVTEDMSLKAISNVFEVRQGAYQGTVAISPTSGPAGTSVDVVARGFPPSSTVEIGVGRVDSEYDVVATAETDAAGRAATQIVIPPFVEPEDRWVIVVAAEEQPVKAISNEFDVTRGAAPTPTEETELFTRTSIYLIAVGDDGQSGKEIGCDDSVVPVEVAIEPTIAPLTAALNELLAIESREYGQSGLYNALYRSDLTLQDVTIQNRQAIIRLSGRLMLGGVCDEPRVRAQLRETALQYATVDRVSIYVNGRPLDELLTAATPTPTGDDLFTRTNIYLIAVADDGQSGKEIGCDDSVIPVQVPIEPTIAPLTAALNELLAIESREYGQSGLYNALYQSDLMLEDVTIENREAIVRLSGTLTVGGVCDGPRIEAQLEETVLQYATVDRVSIFINGTPLEQLLSQEGQTEG